MEEIDLTALEELMKKFSAGEQIIGGIFQFYYFLHCVLDLRIGEKAGFEVKEDVHVEMRNGTCVLSQLKHTVQVNAAGEKINLTDLDVDLWKTISNWIKLLKSSGNEKIFLEKYNFLLITNKNISADSFPFLFTVEPSIKNIIDKVKKLAKKSTKNGGVIDCINSLLGLDEDVLEEFIKKIRIKNINDIVESLKLRVKQESFNNPHYLVIYKNLAILILDQLYLDITNRKNFTITYEDFVEKYGYCFHEGMGKGKLPDPPEREMELKYPEKMEKQKFIEQLIDIGVVYIDDDIEIKRYTGIMLDFINRFEYWKRKNIILPLDVELLNNESKYFWEKQFNRLYREIVFKIRGGSSLETLDKEIKKLAGEIHDLVAERSIRIGSYEELNERLSNGYFYNLSDRMEIGWHYNWKERYK